MNIQDRIHYIKKNRKSPLSFDDYLSYLLTVGLSCLLIYLCYGVTQGIYSHDFTIRTTLFILLPVFLLFSLVVILILGSQRNRRFKEVELNGDFESKNHTITRAAKKVLKVGKISMNKELGLIKIHTKMSALSWGEKVTIIDTDKGVLINSRPYSSQLITIYHDKRNIKLLEKELTAVNSQLASII